MRAMCWPRQTWAPPPNFAALTIASRAACMPAIAACVCAVDPTLAPLAKEIARREPEIEHFLPGGEDPVRE